jgi:tRNA-intron endonuclease
MKSKPLEAWLHHDKVIVSDGQPLYDKGSFGTLFKDRLELSLTEALFLLEKGKIVVYDKVKRPLSVNGFAQKAKLIDPRFWTRYKVYADIRSKGYITKAALKFGADFSVYDKGVHPGKGHSKWLLFAVSSDESFSWRELSAMNRVAHSVKKELLVGVVDSKGDVTYYALSWVRP